MSLNINEEYNFFLDCLCILDKTNIDRCLDLMFNVFDDLFQEGNFEIVDSILERINVESFNTTTLIGFLCSTYLAWKNYKLNNRELLCEKIKEKLSKKEIIELFKGLENRS